MRTPATRPPKAVSSDAIALARTIVVWLENRVAVEHDPVKLAEDLAWALGQGVRATAVITARPGKEPEATCDIARLVLLQALAAIIEVREATLQ